MTLSPSKSRKFHGMDELRDGLDTYPLNELCAVPACFSRAMDAHHMWRRSALGGDFWWVQTESGEEYYENVVGLCRPHHDLVTVDRAWIILTDEGFEWLERSDEEADCKWEGFGLLDPQPGKTEKDAPIPGRPCPTCKRKVPEPYKGEKERPKATWSIKVPKDQQEDGWKILTTLFEAAEEKLGGGNHYTVLCAVLANFLMTYNPRDEEESP